MSKNFPLRIDDNLLSRLSAAADKSGLSQADVARLALERGIPLLLAQLAAEVKVAPIALPPRVIEEARASKMRQREASGSS